jgi:competence protein ComEC
MGGILMSTLIASIAVAPFAAYHFHKSQQFAMLANLLAIPICNLLVMPMALLTLVAMPFGLEAAPLWAMGKGIEAMVWCAYAVAGLPGAVTRIPAIPSMAFGLMVVGGLWLALWQSSYRWLGVLPMLLGLAVAPMRSVPHVLVSRDGAVVGFRAADGRIVATGTRSGAFDLARWLEHDGDDRQADTLLRERPRGLDCDWQGCTVVVRGRRIALGRHPSALIDDCRGSDVVIALFDVPEDRGCEAVVTSDQGSGRRAQPLLIARQALLRGGAHLIYLDGEGGAPRHATVAVWRGRRPWSETARSRGNQSLRQRFEMSQGPAQPVNPAPRDGKPDNKPGPTVPIAPPASGGPTSPEAREDE